MKSTKGTYIDLTDFTYWSGHFTGIQRTVYNIAKQLKQQDKTVRYVAYSQGKYQLIHQDIDSIAKIGITSIQQDINIGQNTNAHKAGLKYASKKYARYVLSKLKRRAARMVSIRHTEVNAIENLYGRTISFSIGDRLVILGGIWNDSSNFEYATDLVINKHIKLTCLFYDLIPVYGYHTFGDSLLSIFSRYVFEILSVADTILSISDTTKKDILRFKEELCIVNDFKLVNVRLGDSIPMTISKKQQDLMTRSYFTPFIISVGTIEARKNHIQIYAALRLADELGILHKIPHIFIIGKIGWLAGDTVRLITYDETVNKKVTILSNIDDGQLAWFYKNAQYTIYTSQYEGWGLPVAEALSYGVPVITSKGTSMEEVAPGLVKLVSPYDSRELLEAMLDYADPDLNRTAREAIFKGFKLTTWEDTAIKIRESL